MKFLRSEKKLKVQIQHIGDTLNHENWWRHQGKECGERERPKLSTEYHAKQGRQQVGNPTRLIGASFPGKKEKKPLIDTGIVARIQVPYCLLHSGPRSLVGPNIGLQPLCCGTSTLWLGKHHPFTSHSPEPLFGSTGVVDFAVPQFRQHWVYGWWSANLLLDVSGKLRSEIWNCSRVTWWLSGKISYINILG